MDFKLHIDPGALVNLPDVKARSIVIQVNNAELVVHFGPEFSAELDRSVIDQAEQIQDPRPAVYLPMGISAAVDRFGRDTICIATSHQGLVKITFNRDVDGTTTPTDYTGKGRPPSDSRPVQFRHLILSLEDPLGFVNALMRRGGVATSRA